MGNIFSFCTDEQPKKKVIYCRICKKPVNECIMRKKRRIRLSEFLKGN